MDKESRILVAGAHGMVGSAICRGLRAQNYENLLTPNHKELDLSNPRDVAAFFQKYQPQYVFVAAAKVGGINANDTYPAEFIYQNLMIETSVIHEAWQHRSKSLLFLGSSCIYPKYAAQPINEEALLGGRLEPTNEPYALAKIAGIKLCESYNRQYRTDFRSLMPCNLYGEGDNFNLSDSHVIPAMMRKFHEAKNNGVESVALWGSGKVRREFLHVDDLASASIYVMNLPQADLNKITTAMVSHLNVGSGEDLTIKELAVIMQRVVGYKGTIQWNTDMPDGTPRKVMDVGKLRKLGWAPTIALEEGLRITYDWYQSHQPQLRK